MDFIDMSEYTEHESWSITSAKGVRNVKKYDCCPEPYIDLTFRIRLERGATYLHIWLVRPFIALALMLPVVFIFPGEVKSVVGKYSYSLFLLNMMQTWHFPVQYVESKCRHGTYISD